MPEPETLEAKVLRFQEADRHGRQTECTDLFPAIRSHCQGVVVQVQSRFRNLGSFAEDIADEKLPDCLSNFQPRCSASFRGYYRTALVNACFSELRRRKKLAPLPMDQDFPTCEHPPEADLSEDIALYALRKRRLIDELRFRPAYKLSTLLLDQRQRTAHASCDTDAAASSAWIEAVEKWHAEDHLRHLGAKEPQLRQIWPHFAEYADTGSRQLDQDAMVAAIARAGARIEPPTWRQRVCRYVADLRDQLDEQELLLFHVKPCQTRPDEPATTDFTTDAGNHVPR